MLQLSITTRPIRLEYVIRHPRLNLEITHPQLHMKTELPKVEIRQVRGKLTIDQTPCRYSIGLKTIADFSRDNVAWARERFLEGIARVVQEGRALADIHRNTNALADIAAEAVRPEYVDVVLKPIQPPIIRYIAEPVRFNPIPGKVHFSLLRGEVRGDFQRGEVNIRVVEYPSVEISVVDVEV